MAAYLQRRHERWRLTWDTALERVGDDPLARLLSVFDALLDLQRAQDAGRGCAFLAAAVEVVEPHHPAHAWLLADTQLLTERLRSLAVDAGADQPDTLAAELILLYDGALAARARRAISPGNGAPPPVRDLAAAVAARHVNAGRDTRSVRDTRQHQP
ncbi:hypothetical protein M1R94_16090 [Actinotalea sp. K2]|nr:hypothetical protein [Actinotalea sp. K2]MCL3862525.1 hypothetical protein [Actinotalea sp. K2]